MNRAVRWSAVLLLAPWIGVATSQLLIPASIQLRPAENDTLLPAKKLYGSYFYGGLGNANSLELMPSQRYRYQHRDCTSQDPPEYGIWQQKEGVVLLRPDQPFSYRPTARLVPVVWDKQILLIDENRMPGFCVSSPKSLELLGFGFTNDYISLPTSRSSPPVGKPAIPEKYQHFIEKGAITARVIGVNIDKSVVLLGSQASRLKPGMRLCLNNIPGELELWSKPELKVIATKGQWIRAKQIPVAPRYSKVILPGDTFTTGSTEDRPVRTDSQWPW